MDRRISGDGSRSCQGCHASESKRRLVYLDGEPAAPGTPGARVAPALRGLFAKNSFMWDGSIGSLQAAVDRMLAVEMRGAKLEGPDREALISYLRSVPPSDNGRIQPDGTPEEPSTLSQRNGFATFKKECGTCHPPPNFRRSLTFDIGTGGKFAVPTLRGLPAEGPFAHDGRWPTLESAVQAVLENRKIELTYRQRLELIEYLKLL